MYLKQTYQKAPHKWLLAASLIILAIAAGSLINKPFAHATGYTANDVIGQTNFTNRYANGISPSATGLHGPSGVAIDSSDHEMFVADTANDRVLVYNLDSSDNLADRTADFVIGQTNFTNGDSGTSASQLNRPQNLTYDSSNKRLFVSDTGNQRVVVYDLSSGITNGMSATWVLGQPDLNSSGCNFTNNGLCNPFGLSYDSTSHQLFVADMGSNRVIIYDLSSGITNGMNASHVLGQANFSDSTQHTSASGLAIPEGVSYDSAHQRLFVADFSNSRVVVYDLSSGITDGMAANWVLGQTDFNSSTAQLTQSGIGDATDVFYDAANSRLFVCDDGYTRILTYDLSSGITSGMNASHVLGQANFTSFGWNLSAPGFSEPYGITYDNSSQRLFVADANHHRVVQYNLAGGITNNMNASAVTGQPNFGTQNVNDTISPTATGFAQGAWTAVDTAQHRLFVTDTSNARVLVFNLDSSNNLIDHTADFVLGQANFNSNTSGTSQNKFGTPQGLTYDSANQRLFVTDSSNHRVMVFDLSSGITNGMNASWVLGQANFTSGSGALTQAGLDWPVDATYDAGNHQLFVVDQNNARVMVYNLGSGITTGMNASWVLGQGDFTTNAGGPEAANNFSTPYSVTYDSSDKYLFVADQARSRVMVFDLGSGITTGMNASHVLGQADFTSAAEGSDQNQFRQVKGIDYSSGLLFVSDQLNARVQVFNIAGGVTDGMNAADTVGAGTQVCSGSPTPLSANSFCEADDVAYDAGNNRLYVSDGANYRILSFNLPFIITNDSVPDGSIDQAYSQAIQVIYGQSPVTYSVSNGNLPDGLSLNTGTGVISGTPTDGGDFNFTIHAADNAGNSDSRSLSIHISTPVQITTNSLPDGQVATSYDQTVQTSGGDSPFDFEVTSGNLPDGLSLDGSSGEITGSALATGDFNFTVSVTDNNSSSDSKSLSIHIADGPVTMITSSLPGGETGASYDSSLSAAGGQTPYSFGVISGSLPTGLTLDSSSGEITGTPTAAGTSNFTIEVTDSDGGIDMQSLSIVVTRPASFAASDLLGQSSFTDKTDNTDFGGYLEGGTVLDTVHHRLFAAACGNWVNVYNLDNNNNLISHSPSTIIGSKTDQGPTQNDFYSCIAGLAYDSARNLLFVDDAEASRVLVFDLSSGITAGMDASYVLGQPDFASQNCNQGDASYNDNSAPVAANTFCEPWGGLAFDPSTNYLYVGDDENSRVMVFDTTNLSNNMDAAYVLGQPGFSTSNRNVTQDGLSGPYGITLDTAHHRLFIADWGDTSRVVVYDTANLSSGMDASFELGETDFTSNDSPADNDTTPDAKSFGPSGLAYDPVHDKLFVYDDDFNRILVFDASNITNDVNAIGVIGQPDFTTTYSNWSDCVPTRTSICDPEGISDAYDTGNNRLYVTDSSNQRVLIFNFAHIITGSVAAGTVDSSYSQAIVESGSQGDVTYSLTSGSLPSGLVLGASTGIISGTPTASGTSNFTVQMSDDNGNAGTYTDSHSYSLAVVAADSGSSPSTNKNSSSSSLVSTAPAAAANTIDLDTLDNFSVSSGSTDAQVVDNLTTGQVLTFTIPATADDGESSSAATESHTVTIGAITADSVTITIHSSPVTLTLSTGEQREIDLNGDGQDDLGVRVNSITPPTASLSFWKIKPIVDNTASPVVHTVSSSNSPARSSSYIWVYAVIAAVIAVLAGFYFARRRKDITTGF